MNYFDPNGRHVETVKKIQRLIELKNNWVAGTLTDSGAAEAKSIKEWLKNESPLNSYSLFNSYVHEIFNNEIDTLEFTNILLEIAAYTGNVYYGKDGGNLAEISNIYDSAVALINDSDPGSASVVFSEKGAKSRYWNTTRKVNVYTLETGKIGYGLRNIKVTLYVDSSRPRENISEVRFGRGNLIIKDYNSPFTNDPSPGKGVGEF